MNKNNIQNSTQIIYNILSYSISNYPSNSITHSSTLSAPQTDQIHKENGDSGESEMYLDHLDVIPGETGVLSDSRAIISRCA